MKHLLKDSNLNGLKATMHYCPECRKLQVHLVAADGWPICHACGYNAELATLLADEPAYAEVAAAPPRMNTNVYRSIFG